MPEQDDLEKRFGHLLNDGPDGAPAPISQLQALSPLTAAAVSQSRQNAPRGLELGYVEGYKRSNQQTDTAGNPIPLDVENGLPPLMYLKMAANRDVDSRIEFLKSHYGENVRVDSFGQPIVRVKDKDTGGLKDIAVNPLGADWHDLADIAEGGGAEMVGSAIALFGSKNPAPGATFLNRVIQGAKLAAKSAAGGEMAGAAKDIAVRGAEGIPIKPGEIASTRLQNAAVGTVLGAGAAPVVEVGALLSAPIGQITPEAVKADTARQTINRMNEQFFERTRRSLGSKSTGPVPEVRLPPSQVTGSEALNRIESYLRPLPASSGVFSKAERETQAALAELQNEVLGLPAGRGVEGRAALPSNAAVGQELEKEVSGQAAAGNAAVQGLRKQAEDDLLGRIVTGGAALERPQAGASIRSALQDAYETNVRPLQRQYDAFLKRPDVAEAEVSGDSLKQAMTKIRDEMPSMRATMPEQAPEHLRGLPFGLEAEDMATVGPGNKIELTEFMPEGIFKIVQKISDSDSPTFRVQDLLSMRRDLNDALATQPGIANTKSHYIGEVKKAVDNALRPALKEISPETLADWESLNSSYASAASKFKNAGIDEIFDTSGKSLNPRIGDNELYAYVTSGPKGADRYKAVAGVLGDSNPAVVALNNRLYNDVLDSVTGIGGTVDAQEFAKKLLAMRSKNPTMFEGIFGTSGENFIQAGQLLAGLKGSIPREELDSILASTSPSSSMKVTAFLRKQDEVAKKYGQGVMKEISSGELGSVASDPGKLTDWLMRRADKSQIEEVMAAVQSNPKLAEDIPRMAFADFLFRAGQRPTKDSLASALGSPTEQAKLNALIGGDAKNVIALMSDLLGGEVKNPTWKMAGGIAAGQMAGKLERGIKEAVTQLNPKKIASYGLDLATGYTVSSILLSPMMRRYALRPEVPNSTKAAWVKGFLASESFLQDVTQHFGMDTARDAVKNVNFMVDQNLGAPSATNELQQLRTKP